MKENAKPRNYIGTRDCYSYYNSTSEMYSDISNRSPQSLFPILLAAFLCIGCTTLVEKTGQVLDGSAFVEKKVAVYQSPLLQIQEMRNKAGEHSLLITMRKFPTMKIRGSAPNTQGEFTITSLDYLGGSPHGWNEYRLDLSGTGNLVLGETTATLSIPDEIETVEISSGRIRRYDTRITGTEALTSLRNRRERISAIAEWLNSPDNPSAKVCGNQKQFDKYWKPILFPEVVSKKKRPAGWQQEGDRRVRAEDIRWNTSYTERVFPELLRPIRDSGTMLRDWEESLDWLFIECEWERITETLSGETVLQKKNEKRKEKK